jgi:hypothetical protein
VYGEQCRQLLHEPKMVGLHLTPVIRSQPPVFIHSDDFAMGLDFRDCGLTKGGLKHDSGMSIVDWAILHVLARVNLPMSCTGALSS